MRNLLLFLGLMVTFFIPNKSLFAQSGLSIEGKVIDAKNAPVPFATVLLKNAADSTVVRGAMSGSNGEFQFQVSAGKYFVQVQFVGCETFTSRVIDIASQSARIDPIVLQERAKMLNEVSIQGQRPSIVHEDGKITLNVANTVVGSSGNVIELLAQAPGVSVDQNDQVSLNGKPGVTILLDGKATYLQPSELAALLKSMNASNVASIEIVANPTARYDAAGNSGVLNIKSKKSMRDGFNGSAQAGAGMGRYGKVSAGINMNYRAKKWKHFLNYNYSFNKRFADVAMDRTSYLNEVPVNFNVYTDRSLSIHSHSWQAGTEWQWNEKNSLTLSTTGSVNDRKSDAVTITKVRTSGNTVDSMFMVSDRQSYIWRNQTAALGYKHVFNKKGEELMADADYAVYSFNLGDDISVQKQNEHAVSEHRYNIVSKQPTRFAIMAARLDYTLPVNDKTTIELGVKGSEVSTRSDVTYHNDQSGEFRIDIERSNDFNYTERIAAAYVNLRTNMAGFQTQFGLRAENTSYNGNSALKNQFVTRDYFRIFPSFNAFKDVTEQYRIGLSYSYRIDRPAYNDLYPFVFYMDPFSGQRGNPGLLPQFTHSAQLSQTFFQTYTVNFSYSNTSQYMAFLILLDEDNTSGYATRLNFDRYYNYNLSFLAPVRLSSKWTANVNISTFYSQFSTQFLSDNEAVDAFSGIANISQTITLPLGFTAEIVTVYNAPNVVGLFHTRASGALHVGLQKSFMQKKATVRLSANDLLRTMRLTNKLEYPGLELLIDNRFETRIVRLNFTYNFGKSGKSSRRRSAQDEEQRRVNTNQ